MFELVLASVVFVGTHLVLSAVPVRAWLIDSIGRLAFMALYSLVAIASLAWMILAYGTAPDMVLFEPGTGFRHLTLSVMAVASFFLVCGYTQPNATAVGMEKTGLRAGPRGVLKITRHPVMWGIALWALSHVLATGHAAAVVFFGAFAVLAIAGAHHIDRIKRRTGGPEWEAYLAATSHVPMLAIMTGKTRVERGEYRWYQILLSVALYMGLLLAHEPVTGRYVLPF